MGALRTLVVGAALLAFLYAFTPLVRHDVRAVEAQVVIPADVPFVVLADHSDLETEGYQLRRDGAIVASATREALVDGVVAIPVASGWPVGVYTVNVVAVGPGGESISDSLAVVVTHQSPSAPTNVIIR
jgi:hypothetical protein